MVEKKKKSSTKGSSPIIDEKELFEELKSKENNVKENQAYELEQPNVVKKIRRDFFITLVLGSFIIAFCLQLSKKSKEPLENEKIIENEFERLKPDINKEIQDFKFNDVSIDDDEIKFLVKNEKEVNIIKSVLQEKFSDKEYTIQDDTKKNITVKFSKKYFSRYKTESNIWWNIVSTIFASLLIFIYYYVTKKNSKTPITKEVLADSCYYLGFLFTFVTLFMVVSFGDFESSKLIIKNMGVALFTTVLGLSLRIYETQFEAVGNEPVQDIQKTLTGLSSNIIDTVTEFQKKLEGVTTELNKVSTVLNKQIDNVDLNQFGKTLDPFKNNIGNLNIELEKIKDDTSRISNEITNSANSLNSLTLTLDKLKTVSDQTEQVVEDFKESNNKLKENQIISNENLELINQKVQSVSESLEKNTSTIEKSSYQVEASTKQFSDASGRMVEETLKIETSMKQKLINLIDFLKK